MALSETRILSEDLTRANAFEPTQGSGAVVNNDPNHIPIDVAMMFADRVALQRILHTGTTDVPQLVVNRTVSEEQQLHVPERPQLEVVTFANPGAEAFPPLKDFLASPLPEPAYIPIAQESVEPPPAAEETQEILIFKAELWYPGQGA